MKPLYLTLEPGEALAVIGEKGSGKTTLCRLLVNEAVDDSLYRRIYINRTLVNPRHSTSKKSGGKQPFVINWIDVHTIDKLIPDLTVSENIFLGHQYTDRFGRIQWNKLHYAAKELLKELKLKSIPYDTRVKELTQLQKIQIMVARYYSRGTQFFIVDEMSRQMTFSDLSPFYNMLHHLKALKKNIIYIPYQIQEITEIADKLAILYKWDISGHIMDVSEISYERIINIMMGKEENTNPITDLFLEKYHITEREKEIILFVASGFSNHEIAEKLGISLGTVKNHLYNIFQKVHVKNRMELCNFLMIK
ncbi:MAG: LuxR C-terminal-related transcriptional regulator [Spirochaetota bacterium]